MHSVLSPEAAATMAADQPRRGLSEEELADAKDAARAVWADTVSRLDGIIDRLLNARRPDPARIARTIAALEQVRSVVRTAEGATK
jgi:hypothetical protein